MAYASLVSLEQTTDGILNHHKYSISIDERQQITSIHEYAIFLITFLENSPGKINRLEGKIRELANEAEDLIEYFIWNQFQKDRVLVTSRKSNGKIKSCSLHDLVRDFCIKKAHEEKFLLTDRHVLLYGGKDERRISIGHSQLDLIQSPIIHSILYVSTMFDDSSLASLTHFKLLRVLESLHYHKDQVLLPSQFFELFHLRFLALPFTNKIPAAISNLENLQTLIIPSRTGLKTYAPITSSHLPPEIWRMPHLRHFVFTEYHELPDPADGSTLPLQNLQTLSGIASFVCSQRILKMIPNLKKLGFITGRNHEIHNLVNLHQLEKLKIVPSPCFTWQGQNPVFPRTLKKLSLVGGELPCKDMSIVGSLPNLLVLKLKLYACYGDTWESSDGEFPELTFLLIENSNLQHWITESNHFPRLKCLVLHDCPLLSRIPDCIGKIPTLELIEVVTRNRSLLKSAKQIQKDQRNYGNDALHVRGS